MIATDEEELAAYREAGRAVVAMVLNVRMPIASIVKRTEPKWVTYHAEGCPQRAPGWGASEQADFTNTCAVVAAGPLAVRRGASGGSATWSDDEVVRFTPSREGSCAAGCRTVRECSPDQSADPDFAPVELWLLHQTAKEALDARWPAVVEIASQLKLRKTISRWDEIRRLVDEA
jgi:hypothetical protein